MREELKAKEVRMTIILLILVMFAWGVGCGVPFAFLWAVAR